jgi:hypothetical protein
MGQPSNPAPVSGPGALSRRTDNGPAQKLRTLPNAQYGEAATYKDLQNGAPLAQTPPPSAVTSGGGASAPPSFVGFDAPSQRPHEPVTAGADAGAGPDSSVLSAPAMSPTVQEYQSVRDLVGSLALRNPSNPSVAYLNAALQRTF